VFRPLLEQVRQQVSGERALESVRALTRFHRVQASPGYDRAADWLAEKLESAGLEVELTQAPGDGRTRCLGQLMPEGWECAHARATLHAGDRRELLCDYETHPLSLIQRSMPASGRYPILVLEDGTEDDHYRGVEVRGRVVLTSGDVHRVHRLAVVERGAAGLLSDGRRLVPPVRDRFDDPDALPYTSFWWGEDTRRGWGFVVSPRAGASLRGRLRAGEQLALEVEIESRAFPTAIPLVSAVLPGRDPNETLVLSHLCHPQPSANDNASGVAATLEAARALAALRAGGMGALRSGIRFLWIPEFTGTYAWLAARPAAAPALAAAVNLDMVGESQELCGSTFLMEHPPCFAASFAEELLLRIRAQAVDWVPSYSGPGHYSLTRMAEVPFSGGSDHAVLVDPAIGVPCPMLIQWPDRFYHSSHDTPDKCDPRSLALAARCAATFAGFLATLGDSERDWLLSAVGRGARRRLLAAADAPQAERTLRQEIIRGSAALASLARVGVPAARLERAREALEGFARTEAGALPYAAPRRASSPVPVRRVAAPLHYQRHLLPGYESLPRSTRERWRALEAPVPDSLLLAEVAWYACDGRRSLAEVVELVELETGRSEPDYLEQFFELTSELGLSHAQGKDAAWSSSARDTDMR
jgi:hypothetical protein